jgi:hypothetical protein
MAISTACEQDWVLFLHVDFSIHAMALSTVCEHHPPSLNPSPVLNHHFVSATIVDCEYFSLFLPFTYTNFFILHFDVSLYVFTIFYSAVVYQLFKSSNLVTGAQVINSLLPSLVCANEILMPSAQFFQLSRSHSLSHIWTRSFSLLVGAMSDEVFVYL